MGKKTVQLHGAGDAEGKAYDVPIDAIEGYYHSRDGDGTVVDLNDDTWMDAGLTPPLFGEPGTQVVCSLLITETWHRIEVLIWEATPEGEGVRA